ncbi:MAG: hypothetical protein Q8P27_03445, partial [Candidatus Peregrinibacteria bacterium]|nr:hypothetical protein [Candidatus Peregrinibacteria bacterium]
EPRGVQLRPFESETFELIPPGSIVNFPRTHTDTPHVNEQLAVAPGKLPSNEAFVDLEQDLIERAHLILRDLESLRARLKGHPPILHLPFLDCLTTRQMRRSLLNIFILASRGEPQAKAVYDRYVAELPVEFGTGSGEIKNARHITRGLRQFIERGGVLIGGGSWKDAFDEYGKAAKELVARPILDDTRQPNSRIVVFAVCFYQQLLGDLIGEELLIGEDDRPAFRTQPGALEIGPSPVHLTQAGRNHGVFRNLLPVSTKAMTLIQTHGGQFAPTSEHTKGFRDPRVMKLIEVLATSGMTGFPAAWCTPGNRIFGQQFHSEVKLVHRSGSECVLAAASQHLLAQMESSLGAAVDGTYGIDPRLIRKNFTEALALVQRGGSKSAPQRVETQVVAEAGFPVFVRTIQERVALLKATIPR